MNLLFIIADQWRADSLGCAGHPVVRTPNLDRLAGGGIRGGAVYGTSDRHGAYPDLDPVTPADLAATIYDRFGFSPRTEIHDKTGRPWRLADGRPITRIFG